MIEKQTIEQIVEKILPQHGQELFLVEVQINPGNDIEVIIDSDDRLTIDQCVQVSRSIEAHLDRDAEDFQLSVYSAGIGQPLKKQRQYAKTVGHTVEIILKDGRKLIGTLTAADQLGLTIEYQQKEAIEGKKRKEMVTHTENFTFDQIKTTKEELTIK